MRLRTFLAISVFAAALPALAAPTCNAPQTVVGNNCVLTATLGWITAGQGTQSVISVYVPPNVSAPLDIEVTGLYTSMGSSYTGYLGFLGSQPGQPGSAILTLKDIQAGAANSIGTVPGGTGFQFLISQICWDPTCTAAAPAGVIPNMASLQFTISSPNTADINPNDLQLTVQFLSGGQVTFEEQEFGLHTNSTVSIVPVNLGATPTVRYVYNNGALTYPFDVISITNVNSNAITGITAVLKDLNGNIITSATIPSIPANGAAGFLVIGIPGNSTASVFPATLTLPAGTDGTFHGVVEIAINSGLTGSSINAVLAQEFYGTTMLNLPVFHSPVP